MEHTEFELLNDNDKKDSIGRRTLPPGQWDEILDRYFCSGLTQRRFCREKGLNFHTFVSRLGLRRKARQSAQGESLGISGQRESGKGFHELQLKGPHEMGNVTWAGSCHQGSLEVSLPCGLVLRGEDPSSLSLLLEGIDLKDGHKKAWYER